MMRILPLMLLVPMLAGCGQEESPKPQQRSLGGQVGDSYRGMLDEARQGVGEANEQMRRTEQAVRDRE